MGDVGGAIKNLFKSATNSLSTLDLISLATGFPLSAATDPLRPLNKLQEITNPVPELKASPPPPPPTILTGESEEKKKRRIISGRSATNVTGGALSETTTYRPTLLGQ